MVRINLAQWRARGRRTGLIRTTIGYSSRLPQLFGKTPEALRVNVTIGALYQITTLCYRNHRHLYFKIQVFKDQFFRGVKEERNDRPRLPLIQIEQRFLTGSNTIGHVR
ncbi:hypothetical protein RRG08_039211 [Elysia crispata]|uniref:Uncharacterized protein n=1 Tax=Elysia crispata TaxID=231223 RepID=A0AAE1ATD6_9GAST|nr:hypothetical protein RRG08_039211 [Elysia crispata]